MGAPSSRPSKRLRALAKVGQTSVVSQGVDQLGDLGAATARLDRLGDAGLQVVLQQDSIDPFERGLCRSDLFHKVRTIGFGLHQPDHAVQMPAHRL